MCYHSRTQALLALGLALSERSPAAPGRPPQQPRTSSGAAAPAGAEREAAPEPAAPADGGVSAPPHAARERVLALMRQTASEWAAPLCDGGGSRGVGAAATALYGEGSAGAHGRAGTPGCSHSGSSPSSQPGDSAGGSDKDAHSGADAATAAAAAAAAVAAVVRAESPLPLGWSPAAAAEAASARRSGGSPSALAARFRDYMFRGSLLL